MSQPLYPTPLTGLLAAYERRFPEEAEVVRRFQQLLAGAGDAALCRSHFTPGHVTASAWIVDRTGRCTLLTHHAKLDRWLQLGGHCEGDPDVLAAAVREAEEESGLGGFETVSEGVFDLDIHPIPDRPGQPAHLHYDVRFALRYPGDKPFTVSEESHDLAWVPLGELSRFTTEPAMLRLATKWEAC